MHDTAPPGYWDDIAAPPLDPDDGPRRFYRYMHGQEHKPWAFAEESYCTHCGIAVDRMVLPDTIRGRRFKILTWFSENFFVKLQHRRDTFRPLP